MRDHSFVAKVSALVRMLQFTNEEIIVKMLQSDSQN